MNAPPIAGFDELDRRARRRIPRLAYDFICGGSGIESALERNRRAFENILLEPRILRNLANSSLVTGILGRSYNTPFGFSPMGMCGIAWANADGYLADAAVHFNLPICVSTFASKSLETMRRKAGKNSWFQLYAAPSPEYTSLLVDRAEDCGYETLVHTVDVPVISKRPRDIRNGLSVPMRLGLKQLLDFSLHPRWSLAMLVHGIPRPENFEKTGNNAFARDYHRGYADWNFLQRLRDRWQGNLIVKGVLNSEDALRIKELGCDAIWVSNHGGRQLDRAPAAIAALPAIRKTLGDQYPLIFDSGIRDGSDVVIALASGADFVMLGRPLLLALAADGKRGLKSYLEFLQSDISGVMAQIGVDKIGQIGRENLV